MPLKREITTTSVRVPTRFASGAGWRGAALCVGLLCALHPACANAQARPSWVSSTQLVSENGFARLRWSVDSSDQVTLFRISEVHSEQQQISFTDQAEIQVWRREPGDYRFWVQACTAHPEGYPQCGESSSQLTLIVTFKAPAIEDIQASLCVAGCTNESNRDYLVPWSHTGSANAAQCNLGTL